MTNSASFFGGAAAFSVALNVFGTSHLSVFFGEKNVDGNGLSWKFEKKWTFDSLHVKKSGQL